MARFPNRLLLGALLMGASLVTSVNAQPAGSVKYKITWEGPSNVSFGGAYAVINQNGSTVGKTLDGQFPKKLEIFAPASATVTASGGSLTQDIAVTVRIHRGGQLCDEATASGRGAYATADCLPVQPK